MAPVRVDEQVLVTFCLVMLSVHIWAVRSEAVAAVPKLWNCMSCWMWSIGEPSKPAKQDDQFWERWNIAKTQQFQRVTAFATHAAGFVLLVFLVGTDVVHRISLGRLVEFPLYVIFTVNYAALLLNFATLESVSPRRMDLFYVGFLLTAVASMLYVETGPLFFMLRGNDALAQGMLALVVLDVRRSAAGGAIYAACCSAAYTVNMSAFRDHLVIEREAQIFTFWQFALWVFSCSVAYAAEYFLKANVKASLENEDLQHALLRVLSGLCDAVLHLDADLLIQNPTPNLLNILAPNAVFDKSALQDQKFVAFLSSQKDQERFMEFICRSAQSSQTPAAAAHVQLCDSRGDILPVELFHTQQGSICTGHLIGIRYSEIRDSCNDLVALASLPGPDFDRSCSGRSPEERGDGRIREDTSSVVPLTEGGAVPWRCPRCSATCQDWGEIISTASGEDGGESFYSRVVHQLPTDQMPPPAVNQLDQQTVQGRFTALHELAPELCREVLSDSMSTYKVVHGAADVLKDEEGLQHVADVKSQVLDELLVGMKLELRWPGLAPTWCKVIAFVTGALPVPCTLGSHAHCKDVMLWQLPKIAVTNISPSWWDLGPQGIYNRVHNAILKRSAQRALS